ncbi:hypothetical protein BS17DRAFT_773051 [Gyrodon lividus]|nr:hypothetical protein BS17DRAFT_773051 [Gyrodon lividus]
MYRPPQAHSLALMIPRRPWQPRLITRIDWLNTARENTEHLKEHGSPVPLVWVLAEGDNLPSKAFPFGEDRNGAPLYIARALLKGCLLLDIDSLGQLSYMMERVYIDFQIRSACLCLTALPSLLLGYEHHHV